MGATPVHSIADLDEAAETVHPTDPTLGPRGPGLSLWGTRLCRLSLGGTVPHLGTEVGNVNSPV